MHKLALAPIAALVVLTLCACSLPAQVPSVQPDADAATQKQPGTTPEAVAASLGAPAQLDPMDTARKASEIASNFPLEMPVIDGRVVRGEAQGADAWDYELAVSANAKAVTAWYLQSLMNRNWSAADLVDRAATGDAGYELTMVKGGAETRVVVTPEGDGSSVSVVLGIGTPVLQTQ